MNRIYNKQSKPEKKEFFERVLEINRVTRVVKGGKRMRFRALVVIGDEKNRVGWGVGKAADVSGAISKAMTTARKRVITIITKDSTIPHPIKNSYKSARIFLKPAAAGTGIIAGGTMRIVLQLAGIKDVVGKMLGSQNKISNTRATVEALGSLVDPQESRRIRMMGTEEKKIATKTKSVHRLPPPAGGRREQGGFD